MSDHPDFDVVVVGAGPAGIAAAVRVRWLKRYMVVPCKVVLIDPASLGGLTQLGTTHLIGPGWFYNVETLKPHLLADIEHFRIPHFRERVVSISEKAGRFQVELTDSSVLTARAVILCSGMKLLSEEPRFWRNGVVATSLGVQASIEKIRKWMSDPNHRRIVFSGTARLSNIMSLVEQLRVPDCRVEYVVEPTLGHFVPTANAFGRSTTIGTIVAMKGTDRLRTLVVEAPDRRRQTLEDVDLLVIDFLSYELNPARCYRCPGLNLDDTGFIAVDRQQRTNIEGLFAAGDATGMPAAVLSALGEGVVAGFGAYRYVYRQKFTADPPLFAYYGFDAELREEFCELPKYSSEAYAPELLSDPHTVRTLARQRLDDVGSTVVEALVNGFRQGGQHLLSVKSLAEETKLPVERVREIVDDLLRNKHITLQPMDPSARSLQGVRAQTLPVSLLRR